MATAMQAPERPQAATPDLDRKRPEPGPGRMVSLDVFRGLTVAGMILVNNPGSWSAVYGPLRHAEWNGWTPTDLVFPFFLFIVGVSMTLSFERREAAGASRRDLFVQLLRRSAIIFALGLFLNGFPFFDLARLRIPGVLQRIAVCYLAAGAIYLTVRLRGQIAAAVALLGGYWLLMTMVPVPGYGAGVLTTEGNLAAWIDDSLMRGHLYRPHWDPEGILSTLPAIATVLFGIFAGRWMRRAPSASARIFGLVGAGIAGVAAGLVVDLWFPINKNLWSSSYTLFTAGLAAIFLAACYWIVDERRIIWWTKPFVIFGSNAIAVYVLAGITSRLLGLRISGAAGQPVTVKTMLFDRFFAPLASPINASLLWALFFVLVCLGAMAVLYRRKIFIKI